MELNKNKWTKKDIQEFQKYLVTFKNVNRTEWSNNLLNTSLPVLSIPCKIIKDIVKEIYEGNYLSFLDHMIWEYYDNTAINGYLLSKITDFQILKKYLDIYSEEADNWATCDVLSFKVKGYEEDYFNLAIEYCKSLKPFKRRIGINILFCFVKSEIYYDKIFKILDSFYEEKEYYVNMINAWLVCECFTRYREKTINYLNHHHLNKFTINKAIQKCRDSHRVTIEDKEMLLKYKIKNN